MPCFITSPTKSDIKETTRQKKQTTKLSNQNFPAKTECQNLKAPSNNIKKQ